MCEETNNQIQESIGKRNYTVREAFSHCFKVPEWSNIFCYWYRMPKHASDLTAWTEIQRKFGITSSQTSNLQTVLDKADCAGRIRYKDLVLKDKARIIVQLVKHDCVKRFGYSTDGSKGDKEFIVVNPAIVYARDWWSPFMQGVMLCEYQNERLSGVRVQDIPDVTYHVSTHEGAYMASQAMP